MVNCFIIKFMFILWIQCIIFFIIDKFELNSLLQSLSFSLHSKDNIRLKPYVFVAYGGVLGGLGNDGGGLHLPPILLSHPSPLSQFLRVTINNHLYPLLLSSIWMTWLLQPPPQPAPSPQPSTPKTSTSFEAHLTAEAPSIFLGSSFLCFLSPQAITRGFLHLKTTFARKIWNFPHIYWTGRANRKVRFSTDFLSFFFFCKNRKKHSNTTLCFRTL